MSEIEPRRESPATHQCRCVIPLNNRCGRMIPLDQPVCDNCEIHHLGENRTLPGRILPLGQP